MEAGGIYVRWRERLWQEQPDGTYLVWDEELRQWQTSDVQPPAAGRTVTTRECPNCGRRVRASLRSCPYCEYGFPEPERKPAPETVQIVPKKKKAARRQASPIAFLVTAVLLAGAVFGLLQFRRARDCTNWKNAVDAYTETAIAFNGLPPGMSEEEFHDLNEARFADRKPGGC